MLQGLVRLAQSQADNTRNKGPVRHPRHLKQFGVNYRGSPIVLDERLPVTAGEECDPYGMKRGVIPSGGDRAPSASGLVRRGGGDEKAVILFDLFSTDHHTALVFGDDTEVVSPVIARLNALPRGTVASFAILPAGSSATAIEGVDDALVDCDGIAYDTYGMTKEQPFTVIVRPDGVIGAVVSGVGGVSKLKYFEQIFNGVSGA